MTVLNVLQAAVANVHPHDDIVESSGKAMAQYAMNVINAGTRTSVIPRSAAAPVTCQPSNS